MTVSDYKSAFPFDPVSFSRVAVGPEWKISRITDGGVVWYEEKHSVQFLDSGKHSVNAIVVDGDGGGSWNILEGVMYVTFGDGSNSFVFDSLRTVNGGVFFSGRARDWSLVSLHESSPLSDCGTVKIAVATCESYRRVTMKRLLQSLDGAGVGRESVVVFVGGAERDAVEDVDGVETRFVTWSAHECTPLAAIAKSGGGDADWWFLLHDTCEVEPSFLRRLMDVDVGISADVLFAAACGPRDPMSNIGLYSEDFLIRCCPLWDELVERGKGSGRGSDYAIEGILGHSCMSGFIGSSAPVARVASPPFDVYGRGVNRQTFIFPRLGVRKHASTVKVGGRLP